MEDLLTPQETAQPDLRAIVSLLTERSKEGLMPEAAHVAKLAQEA